MKTAFLADKQSILDDLNHSGDGAFYSRKSETADVATWTTPSRLTLSFAPDGTVDRVFTGGGPDTVEKIAEAISLLLSSDPEEELP